MPSPPSPNSPSSDRSAPVHKVLPSGVTATILLPSGGSDVLMSDLSSVIGAEHRAHLRSIEEKAETGAPRVLEAIRQWISLTKDAGIIKQLDQLSDQKLLCDTAAKMHVLVSIATLSGEKLDRGILQGLSKERAGDLDHANLFAGLMGEPVTVTKVLAVLKTARNLCEHDDACGALYRRSKDAGIPLTQSDLEKFERYFRNYEVLVDLETFFRISGLPRTVETESLILQPLTWSPDSSSPQSVLIDGLPALGRLVKLYGEQPPARLLEQLATLVNKFGSSMVESFVARGSFPSVDELAHLETLNVKYPHQAFRMIRSFEVTLERALSPAEVKQQLEALSRSPAFRFQDCPALTALVRLRKSLLTTEEVADLVRSGGEKVRNGLEPLIEGVLAVGEKGRLPLSEGTFRSVTECLGTLVRAAGDRGAAPSHAIAALETYMEQRRRPIPLKLLEAITEVAALVEVRKVSHVFSIFGQIEKGLSRPLTIQDLKFITTVIDAAPRNYAYQSLGILEKLASRRGSFPPKAIEDVLRALTKHEALQTVAGLEEHLERPAEEAEIRALGTVAESCRSPSDERSWAAQRLLALLKVFPREEASRLLSELAIIGTRFRAPAGPLFLAVRDFIEKGRSSEGHHGHAAFLAALLATPLGWEAKVATLMADQVLASRAVRSLNDVATILNECHHQARNLGNNYDFVIVVR